MIDQLLAQTKDRMQKSFDSTKQDMSGIRSGRATPALVEHISIAAYGGTQHLKVMEMATITTSDTRTIVISPYDPSTIQEIEKGIQEANTGLTPVVDGEIIRITIPALSEERRLEYIKLAKSKIEAGKVMIRQVRQDAMKDLKKSRESGDITEDQEKVGEKKVQEQTDHMIAELDSLEKKKEAELLQV
jgi:ribosome recycling factor